MFETNLSCIKIIKTKIKQEFTKSITKFWGNQIKNIDHRKAETFFPKINKILRAKQPIEIETIKLAITETSPMNNTEINPSEIPIVDNKFIISKAKDKREIMGAFFESINTPRPFNNGLRLEEIINKKIETYIKDEYNLKDNDKITNFSNNNPAHRPTKQDIKDYFCNTMEVAAILKKLPNKTSTGIDNIPSIVLKHLPSSIIKDYTIILYIY